MPKGSGGSGSSKQSVEGDPDMGIRAPGSTLPVISEGSKNSAIVMAALVNDFEAIQSVVRLQGDQLVEMVGQMRSVGEELKRIQADHSHDRMERISDKEELKALIINLSTKVGSSSESVQRPPWLFHPLPDLVRSTMEKEEGAIHEMVPFFIHLHYYLHPHHNHHQMDLC